MKYLSIKEIAEKWNISERLVQRYCSEKRIEGATKFGGSWAIPEDAQKPTDGRVKKGETEAEKPPLQEQATPATFLSEKIPMPLMNMSFAPGRCMESIIHIKDEQMRDIALCEYYYFSGQSGKASDIAEKYINSPDVAVKLSACWIYAYANLALDRVAYTHKMLEVVQQSLSTVSRDSSPKLKALAVFVTTASAVLLHLPIPPQTPPIKSILYLLPSGMRLFALYIQAHYHYLNGNYGESVGVVETALALEGEVYPIPTIYLHLIATMDYMSLKRPEKAKEHLLSAWHIAQGDDLIEAFGEHHGLLGGMLEAVIKKEYPEEFKRIISITYSFSAGWRKIHNYATGNTVADNLSTTEFSVCMLAARGWLNKEIADHFGISENTVKQHISVSLQKLGISQRKDLTKYMLK